MMIDHETKEKHNLSAILTILRQTMKNSEVPVFISKLYVLWTIDTLRNLTDKQTVFPKEEFDELQNFCHKEMDEIKGAVDRAFEEFRAVEAAKEKQE